MTVNAFRRDFFAAGGRPRRADVVGWIDAGKLPAVDIDGHLYIRDDAAEAFFSASTATVKSTVDDVKATISKRRADIIEAREILAGYGL
jgi:hypothetical protein